MLSYRCYRPWDERLLGLERPFFSRLLENSRGWDNPRDYLPEGIRWLRWLIVARLFIVVAFGGAFWYFVMCGQV